MEAALSAPLMGFGRMKACAGLSFKCLGREILLIGVDDEGGGGRAEGRAQLRETLERPIGVRGDDN